MRIIVLHMKYMDPKITLLAVKLVGNICAESYIEVDYVVKADGIEILKQVLDSSGEDFELKKEICWTLSNIAGGPKEHINLLISSKVIEKLANLVLTSSNYSV